MPFSPIILWTDALSYLFVVFILFFIGYVRKNPHLLASWKRVGHSASGMSAFTVLIFFLGIGFLDTIHFRPALENTTQQGEKIYSVDVLSLLDETSRNGRPGDGIRSFFAVTDESQFGMKTADMNGLLQLRPELNQVLDELEARL